MPSGVLVLCSAGVVVVGGEVVENAAKAPKLSPGSSHLSKGNRTKYNSQLGRIASDNRRVQTDPIKMTLIFLCSPHILYLFPHNFLSFFSLVYKHLYLAPSLSLQLQLQHQSF